jgi:pterin-4a-carbinolamine dehydratase
MADVAIEKTYTFANYYETISFVNALAFIANAQDHHPDLSVHYNRCVVRFNTHDVKGISETDFDLRGKSTRCWAETPAWRGLPPAEHRAGRGQPTAAIAWWKPRRPARDLSPARQEEPGGGGRPGAVAGHGDEGTIEKVEERRNLFYRQDEVRTKSVCGQSGPGADPDRGRARVLRKPAWRAH